jgi:histidinol dehydrogenase
MILPLFPNATAQSGAVKTILRRGAGRDPELEPKVRQILTQVREGGLEAARKLAEKLDGLPKGKPMRLSPREISEAARKCPDPVRRAIEHAIEQVTTFHTLQLEESWMSQGKSGQWLGLRVQPLARVGLYVPGGAAAYPSSVIMNAVPAKVAGVKEMIVTTPCPRGLSPSLAYALDALGLTEVWRIGGAQAIGLLAYGDEKFRRVDKIVGPSNVWAAHAKREVFGEVAIDNIAGPSEILVMFDETANPEWVAADLLSQAEHGSGYEATIAITTSLEAARRLCATVVKMVEASPKREVLEKVLTRYGAVMACKDWKTALEIANVLSPEHAQIMVADPTPLVEGLTNAGAIFVGQWSSEPLGDYVAGPNHVLPTHGTARFASPLGVSDFLKRTSILHYDAQSFAIDAPHAIALADAEGFHHHAQALRIRMDSAEMIEANAPAKKTKAEPKEAKAKAAAQTAAKPKVAPKAKAAPVAAKVAQAPAKSGSKAKK